MIEKVLGFPHHIPPVLPKKSRPLPFGYIFEIYFYSVDKHNITICKEY